jgi:hypothetical protein
MTLSLVHGGLVVEETVAALGLFENKTIADLAATLCCIQLAENAVRARVRQTIDCWGVHKESTMKNLRCIFDLMKGFF